MLKRFTLLLGLFFFLLGIIGTLFPLLPTTPFLLLAAYCFSKSSSRLTHWFKQTSFYQQHLQDYVCCRKMTLKSKRKIMISISLLMMIGFIIMGFNGLVFGCILLFCIWLFHIFYFCFVVKTLKKNE